MESLREFIFFRSILKMLLLVIRGCLSVAKLTALAMIVSIPIYSGPQTINTAVFNASYCELRLKIKSTILCTSRFRSNSQCCSLGGMAQFMFMWSLVFFKLCCVSLPFNYFERGSKTLWLLEESVPWRMNFWDSSCGRWELQQHILFLLLLWVDGSRR